MPICRGKKRKGVNEYTVTPEVMAEWERKLKRMGLTMDAGRSDLLNYGLGSDGRDFDGREWRPEDKA